MRQSPSPEGLCLFVTSRTQVNAKMFGPNSLDSKQRSWLNFGSYLRMENLTLKAQAAVPR